MKQYILIRNIVVNPNCDPDFEPILLESQDGIIPNYKELEEALIEHLSATTPYTVEELKHHLYFNYLTIKKKLIGKIDSKFEIQ